LYPDQVLFLIRVEEAGRDAQPARSGQRRDIVNELTRALPQARIQTGIGRILLDAPAQAEQLIGRVHGIASFSPCIRCPLDRLRDEVVALAHTTLPPRGSFRIRVRRTGQHDFTSQQKAAELGAAIKRALPASRVDFRQPQVCIGIEIRDAVCYIYHRVIPGLDRAGVPPRPPAQPPDPPRFLLDHMLGKLVVWLRLLGIDAAFAGDEPDSALLRWARRESRLLVTCDRKLAQATSVPTFHVQARDPVAQLAALGASYDLCVRPALLLSRCSQCNVAVQPVPASVVARHLPASVTAVHDDFSSCPRCQRIYWKGRHYERILATLRRALPAAPG
jgi:uncharacterized protein with PIN domain